jgi:cytosine/adenosine deaminase-related metal-dependent hydrolase
VETQIPGEFFTQMRSVFTLQRMQILSRERAGEKNAPKLLTAREGIEFATIEGAPGNQIDRKVGTLTPGKEADLLMLRVNTINTVPVNNVYGAVMLAMGYEQRR